VVGYLDPVTRRRIAAVLLVAGAIVAGLAIGNVGPFANPPTEADRARATLEEFFAAAERKDFAAVCATLTAAERSQIEIRATEVASSRISCTKVLDSPVGLALGRLRVTIEDVRVSGNLAAIDAMLRLPGAKRPEYRTYKLEELGGRWRISDISL
jgi:ketosteroid isomerase-like protein